ncbi:hypothetical protein MHLP_03470 [Candidatus Mycoplasma haematolamae str. Purdue]|uniref:Uncharacterized protein n=1 Tax=Mycoplasma haematolamae (strain Purdue) TaxID=1212765 RepID=I7CK62_MYCHA|nr:hypothetical protein MHLP_03470 [Candidatus Mycoplasma haematolamae str. Purdue]
MSVRSQDVPSILSEPKRSLDLDNGEVKRSRGQTRHIRSYDVPNPREDLFNFNGPRGFKRRESIREERVLRLLKERNERLKRYFDELSRYQNDYVNLRKKVSEYWRNRNNRVGVVIPQLLTQNERRAIQEFYKKFRLIELEHEWFVHQLHYVDPPYLDWSTLRIYDDWVTKSLSDMKWDQLRIRLDDKKDQPIDHEYERDWGSWDNDNPFRHYFPTEDEWLNKSYQAREFNRRQLNYENTKAVCTLFSPYVYSSGDEFCNLSRFDESYEVSQNPTAVIEYQVAAKVLEIMNQLDKEDLVFEQSWSFTPKEFL